MKTFVSSMLFLLLLGNYFAQSIHPYLQAPTPTSMYVNWKTGSTNTPSIMYGTNPQNLSSTVTGSASQFIDGGYSGNYFYNTVQMINLSPNTKYYYKVISGAEFSDTLSFKTLQLPGQAARSEERRVGEEGRSRGA